MSDRPWQLPVDTLVIVERTEDNSPLDLTLTQTFPSLEWARIRLQARTLNEPVRVGVRDSLEQVGGLSAMVFSPSAGSPRLAETCARGVAKASLKPGTRLAIYVNGYSPEQLEAGLGPASVDEILGEQVARLDRLVLVVSSSAEAAAVSSAWALEAEPNEETVSPAKADEPDTDQLLAGGISADLVRSDCGIPAEADRLGLTPYVSMLATAITRRDTPLPLSIGVFGPWGSGKSYFMGLLRDQVARLAGSGDEVYAAEVIQIGFNAWSYADANLWASLGDEIFGQLLDAGEDGGNGRPGDQELGTARVNRLRKELETQLSAVRDLEQAKTRVREDTARIRADLSESRNRHRITLRQLARAAARSGAAQDLPVLWQRLGVTDEVDQGRRLAAEATAARNDLTEVRSLLGGRRFTLGAVLGVVVLLVAGILVLTGRPAAWIAAVGLGGLAAWLGVAALVVGRARSGLTRMAAVLIELREDELAPELAAVRDAESAEQVLEVELQSRLARTTQLDAEIAELTPGRSLYKFLAERAGGPAYREQLGLVSIIRRDLESLVRLMSEWRRDPAGKPPAIERIVLYIDDLDRCPPARVTEVLQAVHLLLALELFVVVVGVDSRWLLKSLASEYQGLLVPQDEPEPLSARRLSSPRDYLEKIFNLPFVLPDLTPAGYGELIRSFSQDDQVATGPSGLRPRTPSGADPITVADGPSAASPVIDAESEIGAAAGRSVTPVPVTDIELRFLTALAPLARSPREAKRMFNIYRMLRATRDLNGYFLRPDGEYQAVAMLLGLQMGDPVMLDRMLWTRPDPVNRTPGGLMHRSVSISWSQVVRGLEPRWSDGGWANDLCAVMTENDVLVWRGLLQKCEPATALVTLPNLAAFQSWAPHVGRFCFENPAA